jgi:plasmid replication initiation protein
MKEYNAKGAEASREQEAGYSHENAVKFYASAAWRRLRVKVIEEEQGKCQMCGRSYKEDGVVIHVDHIVPLSVDWSRRLDETNLQLLCEDCNLGKSNHYLTDWRKDESHEIQLQTKIAKKLIPLEQEFHVDNSIIRGSYDLSKTAQVLIDMGLKLCVKKAPDIFEATFSITDFFRAAGIEIGGAGRLAAKAAIDDLSHHSITYDDDEGTHESVPWIVEAKTNLGWDNITIRFNPDLKKHIIDLKTNYTRLSLSDESSLQSKYAVRFYKFIMSQSGFAGQHGNKPGEWFAGPITLDELRILFEISPNEYRRTNSFRVKVIDMPIIEINSVGMGIHVDVEYIRKGGNPDRGPIKAIKLHCRWEDRRMGKTISPATQTEDEDNAIIHAHQEEADEMYKELMAKYDAEPLLSNLDLKEETRRDYTDRVAWGNVAIALKEKYPAKIKHG